MNDYLPFYPNPFLYIYSYYYYWISLIPTAQLAIHLFVRCWTRYLSGCARYFVVLLEATARVFKASSAVLPWGFKGCSVWFHFHFNSNQQLSAVSQVRNCVLNDQSPKCSCTLWTGVGPRLVTSTIHSHIHILTLKGPQLAWCLCLWTVGGNWRKPTQTLGDLTNSTLLMLLGGSANRCSTLTVFFFLKLKKIESSPFGIRSFFRLLTPALVS